ncbi:MAG: 1,2-phenylacetyl-CoA epoxidase subunit PaaC [Flavobacteriales bacterium]
MTENDNIIHFLYRLGDNSLITGQRLAEWCSKGPTLEEDVALTNISLDNFGQARMIFSHLAEIENKGKTEDDYAFGRNEREFFNALIVERPNGHFGDTIAKGFLFDAFQLHFYQELTKSSNEFLAGLAAKSLKEVQYHVRHSGEWVVRLGDGTEESKEKIQESINTMWEFTGDMFATNEAIDSLTKEGIAPDYAVIKEKWTKTVEEVLYRATLKKPEDCYMQQGSLTGLHSEFLGHLLGDMQYLQRAYPDAKW